MKKYKAIIYDLDGTLIDSKIDVADTTNATIKQFGSVSLDEKVIYEYVGHGVRDLVRQALPDHTDEDFAEILKYFNDYYWDHCLDHTTLYPGTQDILEYGKKEGIAQAVWTNKPQKFTDKVLEGLQIRQYFDLILGAENGFPIKPDSAGTEYILNNLNVTAGETLMVGDTGVDLETAQKVGMDCVLMLEGYTDPEEILKLKGQTKGEFQTFFELKKFIKSR